MVESTRDYLRRRNREIDEEIDRLTAERADIRKALNALGLGVSDDERKPIAQETQEPPSVEVEPPPSSKATKGRGNYRRPSVRERMGGDIATMEAKPLILRALSEAFPTGATTLSLREFLDVTWNRPIHLPTLQVTLSQLKQEGEIYFHNRLWFLVDRGESE